MYSQIEAEKSANYNFLVSDKADEWFIGLTVRGTRTSGSPKNPVFWESGRARPELRDLFFPDLFFPPNLFPKTDKSNKMQCRGFYMIEYSVKGLLVE